MRCVFVGSLQIQETKESDEGKYECVAENNVGVSYSYGANLYVRGTYSSDPVAVLLNSSKFCLTCGSSTLL